MSGTTFIFIAIISFTISMMLSSCIDACEIVNGKELLKLGETTDRNPCASICFKQAKGIGYDEFDYDYHIKPFKLGVVYPIAQVKLKYATQ